MNSSFQVVVAALTAGSWMREILLKARVLSWLRLKRAKERPLDFYESEMLGYDVPARCDSCMNCQHCTLQKEGITVKEKKELQDMKDNIWPRPSQSHTHSRHLET